MARWWPFGNRSAPTPAGGPSTASSTASAPGSPAADPGRPAGDRPGAAWRALPALQRTIGPMHTVAPTAPFAAGLASHRNPAFLGPLGHLVDPRAPGGEVAGVIRTSTLPVQRAPIEAGYPVPALEYPVPSRQLTASGRIPSALTLTLAVQTPVVTRLATIPAEVVPPAAHPDLPTLGQPSEETASEHMGPTHADQPDSSEPFAVPTATADVRPLLGSEETGPSGPPGSGPATPGAAPTHTLAPVPPPMSEPTAAYTTAATSGPAAGTTGIVARHADTVDRIADLPLVPAAGRISPPSVQRSIGGPMSAPATTSGSVPSASP